ncbi:MAG: HEAT repeat domain-containing protein [Verrucomicrobiales bacterium]
MKNPRLPNAALLALLAALAAGAATPLRAAPSAPDFDPKGAGGGRESLEWGGDLDSALALAKEAYAPVAIFFSSPGCAWCARMKRDVLTDPAAAEVLKHFVRVEIDISKDRAAAVRFQVTGSPALRILDAAGTTQAGADGYLGAADLRRILSGALNAEFLRQADAAHAEAVDQLDANEVPAERWPELLTAFSDKAKRADLHPRILKLEPFPAAEFVDLLGNAKLAVRLGALDILEELAGGSFGFDPWLAPDDGGNAGALAAWKDWLSGGGGEQAEKRRFAALSEDSLAGFIRDLISEDRERAARALRMLEQGGGAALEGLGKFLGDNPEIGADAARRIREAQYTLTIPAAAGGAPSALARRLVYGNLDTRLSALEELGKGGKHAVPILRDFLADPESMVREAAVDALAATGDLRVVSLIDEQIKTEPDTNVIHAALRGLGGIRSKRGLALLAEFTTSESEDLAVAALEGIERLRTTQASEAVIKALDDPRWRVRAAALETVGKVELGDAAEKVRKLLGDEDSFVRYSALQAIVEMGDKGAAAELTKLYESAPDLRGPILEAIGRLSLPLPAAIKSALASESNPDTLIAAVGELPGTGADGIRLTAEFLQHENLDVACAAGRSLASQSLKHPEARGALVAALEGGNEKMANAILENISIGYDLRQMLRKLIRPVAFSLDPAAPTESTALDPLYNAFLDAAQGSAPGGEGESPDPAAVTSADVFESFLGVAQPGESEPAPGEKPESSSLPGFIAALEAFLAPDAAQHLRYRAALLLAAAGNGSAAEFLSADLDQRTVEQRAEIADSLDGLPSEKILPLLRILLQDPAESVRKNAAYACMAHAESSPAFADAAFEELVRLDSNLQPTELYNYRISSALNSRNGRRTFARWAKELVGRHSAESLQVMGLILLEQTWAKGDAELVKPFLTAESPWLRRAAFYAFGKNDEAAFREHIPALTADTSEHVRAVLAGIYGGDNSDWTHYFSRDSLASNQSSSYSSRRRRLPEEAEKALADLAANDPSPKVRVESAFTLIANSREIDLRQFVTTINALPDRKAIADRVADFLSENFRSLGTGFRVLLPVLDASSGRIGNLDEIYAHFGLDSSDEDGEIVYVSREEESAPVPASFLAPLAGDAVAAAAAGAIKLLYFYSPGCAECARVDDYLDQLRSAFPRLEVERHNIRDPDAMRVNEALCALRRRRKKSG